MKATLYARPSFKLQLSKEELDILMVMSKHHYDGVCRSYAGKISEGFKQNGLLAIYEMFVDDDRVYVQYVEMRQIDTLAKICENRACLDEQQKDIAWKLSLKLISYMRQAGDKLGNMSWDL